MRLPPGSTVEGLALPQLDDRGWVAVAVEEMIDVILSSVTSQSDEAEIWWDGSVVCSGHVVGEGLWEVVAELAGTHEHLAGLVRTSSASVTLTRLR